MMYIFYFFALLSIGLGLYAVSTPHLVRAVFALFGCLFAVAGLYVFAQADFVAVAQVVIYVGGVLVLLIFGVMLSDKTLLAELQDAEEKVFSFSWSKLAMVGAVLILAVLLMMNMLGYATIANQQAAAQDTVHAIGVHLMATYLLPFELLSILLLAVLVATVFIARKGEVKA